ncbi:MAG: hypothetical protein WC581_13655 [Thermodesulfovibrionales bacterium]
MTLSSVDLDIKRFGREIELFLAITDRIFWETVIKKSDAVVEKGIYKDFYFSSRNPFIKPLKEYFHMQSTGKSMRRHRTKELDYLAGKAFIINRILSSVNERVKKQIKGRLTCDDIRPFLHEIDMATHFLRNKFDITFIEYERPIAEKRTYDFLVIRNSVEAEIECKWKSYDAGRKIKRDSFYMLCDEILKQVGCFSVKCIIEINCAEKLDKNRHSLFQIATKIKTAVTNKETTIDFDQNLSIDIIYLPEDLRITSDDQFRSVIKPYWKPQSHFATLSNETTTIIVRVESEERDRVLKAIYDELKNSLDQFSKSRPGLIACYIEGVYPEDWEELRGPNGLAAMTTHLLRRENADHIHTIAYSSEVEMLKIGKIIDSSYPVLFFKNPNCKYYREQDIFSVSNLANDLGEQ